MTGIERRKQIIECLKQEKLPMSGSRLAKKLSVSRQAIVQDIALLRAKDYDILSTSSGYMMVDVNKENFKRVFKVWHTTDNIKNELYSIIDHGGKILDVYIEHPVYDKIQATLNLESRYMIDEFIKKMNKHGGSPLKDLSRGAHYHTVEAKSVEVLDQIEKELAKNDFLVKE